MRKRFVGNMILVNWRYNGNNNVHEDARLRQQNSHMLVSRCSHASASWHSAQRTLRGIQKAIGKLNFVAGTLLFSLQALFISFSFILCKFHNPTRQDRYQGEHQYYVQSHVKSLKTPWTSATKSAPPPVLAMVTVPNLLDQWPRLASPANILEMVLSIM